MIPILTNNTRVGPPRDRPLPPPRPGRGAVGTPLGVAFYPPLTLVTCDGSIPMLLVQVRISANNYIDYYCEWWVESQLNTGWFDEGRIEPQEVGGDKQQAGYLVEIVK